MPIILVCRIRVGWRRGGFRSLRSSQLHSKSVVSVDYKRLYQKESGEGGRERGRERKRYPAPLSWHLLLIGYVSIALS